MWTHAPEANTSVLKRVLRIAVRIGVVLCVAFLVGVILNRISATLEKDARPAGFTRGMLQGALMPMTFPNLIVGNEVTIYSERNTGRSYKLGYTLGVNVCGIVFFGLFFWRLTRWTKYGKRRS